MIRRNKRAPRLSGARRSRARAVSGYVETGDDGREGKKGGGRGPHNGGQAAGQAVARTAGPARPAGVRLRHRGRRLGRLPAANRLSADPDTRVLLLEAGGAGQLALDPHPGGLPVLHRQSAHRLVLPHPARMPGSMAAISGYPRGRVLGGSSSINGMIYMRGQRQDYDGWAARRAIPAGRWDDVLPLFKADGGLSRRAPAPIHGEGGEWRVERQRLSWDLLDAFARRRGAGGHPLHRATSTAATTKAAITSTSTSGAACAGTRPSAFLRPILKAGPTCASSRARTSRGWLFEGRRARWACAYRGADGAEQLARAPRAR